MFRRNRTNPWDSADVTGWKYSIVPDGGNDWKVYVTDPQGNRYGSSFGLMSYVCITAKTAEKAEQKVIDRIKKMAYENTVIVSNTL
jgi:hypothetical protein